MTALKKPHPEDILIARLIAQATEFIAYYRNGPHETIRVPGFATYDAAKAKVDEIVKERSKFGRGGIVYAITDGGRFPCDEALIAMSREMAR